MRNLAKHLPDSSGFDLKHILVEPGKPISLKKDFDPAYSGNFKDKEETLTELRLNIEQLAGQQDILYPNGTYALLGSQNTFRWLPPTRTSLILTPHARRSEISTN